MTKSVLKNAKQTLQNANVKAKVFATSLMVGGSAHAAGSVISSVGEKIFCLFTGELAVWIFLCIVVSALLIGLLGKMDFSTIIKAVVIIGIIQGILGLLSGANITGLPTSVQCRAVTG